MRKLTAYFSTTIIIFCLAFLPTITQASYNSTCWLAYPFAIQNKIGSICTYKDKIVVIDELGNIIYSRDGENWSYLSDKKFQYGKLYSNNKSLIIRDMYSDYISYDGVGFTKIKISESFSVLKGSETFITEPGVKYKISDDGVNWKSINLNEQTVFNKYRLDFSNIPHYINDIVMFGGKYYLFTYDGVSFVSDDLEHWNFNAEKINGIKSTGLRFGTIGQNNDMLICYSYLDGVWASTDAKSWKKICTSPYIEWDGKQYVNVDDTANATEIRTSIDGQKWNVVKTFNKTILGNMVSYNGQGVLLSFATTWSPEKGETSTIMDISGNDFKQIGSYGGYSYDATLFGNRMIAFRGGAVLKEFNTVNIMIDGENVNSDQSAVIYKSRTLVPLRSILEKLGASVEYDASTKTVTSIRGNNSVMLRIGEDTATANGTEVTLDVPAKIMNGRTMVPVRFISESLGCKVEWEPTSQTVLISAR